MVTNGINIQVPLSVLKPFSIAREIKVPLNSPSIKSLSRSPLVHRVNAGVNFNVQQRGHSQGRCTASCAASSTEGWEHADLENRCLGSFRLCRNTVPLTRTVYITIQVTMCRACRPIGFSYPSRASSETTSDFYSPEDTQVSLS